MKYVKILGLLAVAATALMAFAASAGATTITTGGTVAASTIESTNESNLTLSGGGLTVTCEHSEVKGSIASQGTGKTATGNISTLTFTKCNQHVTVVSNGSLEAHWTSGSNGTLTSSGATVTVEFTTIFGAVHCLFNTNNTNIGTLTGAANHSTGKATLDISATIPTEAGGRGGGLCPSTSTWSGSYVVNVPAGATVDQN
jgi:hypothetical protein